MDDEPRNGSAKSAGIRLLPPNHFTVERPFELREPAAQVIDTVIAILSHAVELFSQVFSQFVILPVSIHRRPPRDNANAPKAGFRVVPAGASAASFEASCISPIRLSAPCRGSVEREKPATPHRRRGTRGRGLP